MRILQMVSVRAYSGAGVYAVNLSAELARRGHEVEIACIPGGGLERAARQKGLGLAAIDLGRSPLAARRRSALLARFLARRRIQIVHVHRSPEHFEAALALRALAPSGPPIVRTWHCGTPARRTLFRGLLFGFRTSRIVVSAACVLETMKRKFPRLADRTRLIYGGVDTDLFRPDVDASRMRERLGIGAESIVVGTIGKLAPERRMDVILRAAASAIRGRPGASCLVIGEGPQGARLKRLARSLGIRERVFFAGNAAGEFVERAACVDIGVQIEPGSDGSCRAAMELMALGRPMVVSRRGVLPELVEDGVCGIVAGDGEEPLARALAGLIDSPETRRRMGDASRRRVAGNFGLARLAAEYEKLYGELAGGEI